MKKIIIIILAALFTLPALGQEKYKKSKPYSKIIVEGELSERELRKLDRALERIKNLDIRIQEKSLRKIERALEQMEDQIRNIDVQIRIPDPPEIDVRIPEIPEINIQIPEVPEVRIEIPEIPELNFELPEIPPVPEIEFDDFDYDYPNDTGNSSDWDKGRVDYKRKIMQ